MLALADPRQPIPRSLLSREGSFLWWYLDLVDERGDGLVLIWAFGLPFVPGQGLPQDRPSLCLSVYEGGRVVLYLVQACLEAGWEEGPAGERWRFDDCVLSETIADGRRRLEASLRLPLPRGGELEGSLHTEGPALAHPGVGGEHQWTPVTGPGRGRAELAAQGWSLSLEGSVYRDRNACPRPLDTLGITDWSWGRALVGESLWIWYLVRGEQPHSRLYRLDEQLVELPAQVAPSGWTRDRYGLRWPRGLHIEAPGVRLAVRQEAPVDRGPFYLRHPVRVELDGLQGRGWSELVRPDRVDLPWLRPFVEMKVHRRGARGHWLLPSFTGLKPPLAWL